jgi:hypothetical protein
MAGSPVCRFRLGNLVPAGVVAHVQTRNPFGIRFHNYCESRLFREGISNKTQVILTAAGVPANGDNTLEASEGK